jgi:hypothetical protein
MTQRDVTGHLAGADEGRVILVDQLLVHLVTRDQMDG